MDEEQFRFKFGQSAELFSTVQRATEGVLEALGVTLYGTPVIVCALAPVELVAAILRAGGLPLILDVNDTGTGYDLKALNEALEDLEEAVVIHYRPLGGPIPLEDTVLSFSFVTIQVSPVLNRVEQKEVHKTTFSVYDLVPACSAGALVYSKFEDQRGVLKQVRLGVLGMGDRLSHETVQVAGEYFKTVDYSQVVRYYPIKVKDAEMGRALLHAEGIESWLGRVKLTSYDAIKSRFSTVPTYTNADKLHNTLLLVPCEKHSLKIGQIFYTLQSVLED